MFGKNLKYYRLKNNMSMKELADLVQVSPMSISYYEKEERRPNMDIIKALARALHVRVTDFLAGSNQNLVFCHEEFRKNSKLSGKQQEYVKEEVENYFGRFYETVNISCSDYSHPCSVYFLYICHSYLMIIDPCFRLKLVCHGIILFL